MELCFKIEEVLQQAIRSQNQGDLQYAEKLYRSILEIWPSHPDANHNLGVLAITHNKLETALPLFRSALVSNLKIEQFWISYITTLIADKQFYLAGQTLTDAKNQGLKGIGLYELDKKLTNFGLTKENKNMKISRHEHIKPPQFMLAQLLEHYKQCHYKEAEALALNITQEFPHHAYSWNILGIVQKQVGRLLDAVTSFQKLLQLSPNNSEAHSNLGITLRKLGSLNESELSLRRAIHLQPDFGVAHNSLGNTLEEMGKLEESRSSYMQAIFFEPAYAFAHYNLSIVLQKLGMLEDAELSIRRVLELDSTFTAAQVSLGNILQESDKLEEAVAIYKQAIAISPNLGDAHYNLGITLHRMGRIDEARQFIEKAVEFMPDLSEGKHLLAALNGETTNSPPRAYVEKLFDKYASRFEKSLVDDLEYKIHIRITQMILEKSTDDSLGSILDLGCGTGLVGTEIRNCCHRIEGVDISESMLAEAKKKNLYDKLTHQEIADYLTKEKLDFDYFILTDVFIYIGDLSDVFRLIKARNSTGGRLVFSIEQSDGESFYLEKTGRYSHSKSYIANLCELFGYTILHFETIKLRKEHSHFIAGELYILEF